MFKNCFTLNNKLLAVILLAGIQPGCNGDGDGGAEIADYLCLGGCEDLTSLTAITPTPINYLDCSNLDPAKVYLRGTLQEGLAGREAIIDPADPTTLCVGFPSGASADGQVTGGGRYIHDESQTIYSMVQEPFDTDASDDPVYPATPLANDTALLTTTAAACAIGLIMINPDNNITYYSCPANTIHTEASVPYYALGNGDLLSVLADGSMLVGEFDALRIVDTLLVETPIVTPGPATVRFLTAKLFTDPVTFNPSVWVVVEDGANPLQRWSIDLTTMIVTNDGDFSAVPAGITEQNNSSKLDGNGDLWQTGDDTTGFFIDVIIERPILSSGAPATVVYTEADDDGSEEFFVKIHISNLFTGM